MIRTKTPCASWPDAEPAQFGPIGEHALLEIDRQPADRDRVRADAAQYSSADTVSGAAHTAQPVEFSRLIEKFRKDDRLVAAKLDPRASAFEGSLPLVPA